MEELLARLTTLKESTFAEWLAIADTLPQKIEAPLHEAYMSLDKVCVELIKLIRRKHEEGKE